MRSQVPIKSGGAGRNASLLIALALFHGMHARAQTAVPAIQSTGEPVKRALTLTEAVQLAGTNYPAIRAAQQQEAAAQRQIGVARAAYLPRADMLWQVSRATTNKPNVGLIPQGIVPVPDTPARAVDGHSDWNNAEGVLFAWQPFDFGQRSAQVKAARYGAAAAAQATGLSQLDVASAAAGAFFDVAAARMNVEVQQANVKRMEVFAKTVHVLVDNKLRPSADASQADAQLALARTQVIQAQTLARVRLEALANLLQVPAQQLDLNFANILVAAPANDLIAVSVTSHPEIKQQAAVVSQQQEQVHLLSRSYAPFFTTYGSVSGLGAGLANISATPGFEGGTAGLAPTDYNWMAAVQITFPAFQIFTLRQQKKVQEATAQSAQATYRQMLGDLSAQVREAQAMLDGARQVAQNTPVEVAAARQSEQQQQARFQASLATVVEVSVAESVLTQAEADDALARLNVWRGLAGVAEAQGDLNPFLNLVGK